MTEMLSDTRHGNSVVLRRLNPTLIQALVVVFIIGTLVAILLPATQSAREAAREAARKVGNTWDKSSVDEDRMGQTAGESQDETRRVNQDQLASSPRKIIYDAEITLVVQDFAKTESAVVKLVKQNDGYVADALVDRTHGEQLAGRWRIRIPAANFDAFLSAVSTLGIPESRHQTAQDVTEEFVDLEARISNKKRLEERIVELLSSSSGEIKDVIEVERELARVRTEIEQIEGRLRHLTDRTDFTTVTISAREVRDYVPPEAPSYFARICRAWGGSLLSLRDFIENLSVAMVYAFPWAIVIGTLLAPALWYVRKRNARRIDSATGEKLRNPSSPGSLSDP